ncbi:hypothetical protein HY439_00850 [Candidatus Microgenomates bacterium]|nr:hypothetical protein [Candidatus Microgenomates bacterium]
MAFKKTKNSLNQRGNFLIALGITILVLVFGGVYYLGTQSKSSNISNPGFKQVPQTTTTKETSSARNTTVSPSPSTTSTTKSSKNLIYRLPSDWKTVIDTTGRLEVGYDASRYDAKGEEKVIDLSGKWINRDGKSSRLGWNKNFYLTAYAGGSRHNELYKILGENPISTGSTTKDYSEREYSYNGWKCLVINGISISDYPVAWGYCPISTTEALVLAFDNFDWSEIEQQITAVRLLK